MKKFSILCMVLCLAVLFQCAAAPVAASETTEPSETAATEVTEPYVEPPAVSYGGASVTNGCRTINGLTPLAGSDRILKSAQAAFIYEIKTQTVVYAYNPDIRMYPGSLAKILTALIAIEQGDLDEVVTFSTKWNSTLPARSIVADLKEGEEVTLEALVYWVLLASANDAALNIAGHIGGTQEAFVEMMNERAAQLGCTDTHFTNATGLDDPEQYTTARDIVKIVLAAIENEAFKTAFGSKGYTVPPTNKVEEERIIETDNHLIYEFYLPQFNVSSVTGGKTSSTAGGGSSLVCTAEDNDMSIICLVMGAEREYNDRGLADYYGNFEEIMELLDFCFSGFKISRVLYPDMAMGQFPVLGGECDVVAQPDISVNSVLPVDCQMKNLIIRYSVDNVTAPIDLGEKLGTVTVWYRTSCVTESEIFAMNPVRSTANSGVTIHSVASRDDSNVTGVLKFLGSALAVVLVIVAGYLAINWARRTAARNRRRRRRASRRRSR